jgi:60 kDa SS-A/Ro ribonucleoprotein
MKLNTGTTPITTHEGTKAYHLTPELQLRRLVMACLLWEDQFYINGIDHAELIKAAVLVNKPETVMQIAIEARSAQKLRHVPLLLAREMCRHKTHRKLVAKTLEAIIQRPDELAEFLVIYDPKYARDQGGKGEPLAAQVKKGLAKAFAKFDAYSLAKYDRADAKVRLKDVLFLSHAKPKDGSKGMTRGFRKVASPGEIEARISEGGLTYKKLVENELETPDTWEVNLSKLGEAPGQTEEEKRAAKLAAWTRLLTEQKLGGLALLRNLRNMRDVGVDTNLIATALAGMKTERILPFRFIAAAKAVPEFESMIEPALFKCASEQTMPGKTALCVDVSGSMEAALSAKSQMTRMDAACGLAMLAREQFPKGTTVYTFSNAVVTVPARRGFALRDAIVGSQGHGSTNTSSAIKMANRVGYDRLIVITDEQSHTAYPAPLAGKPAYVINIGAYKNGLGYGPWTHIDGFSEATLKFIGVLEQEPGPEPEAV